MCFRPPSMELDKKCPSCNAVCKPTDTACPSCGAKLSAAPGMPAAPGAPGMPAAPGAPGAPKAPGTSGA